MLGLLLIYFIGKYFYDLAENNNRNKWLFAILGVAVYYLGTFIFGIALGLIAVITNNPSLLDMNNLVLSLIAIPSGLLFVWIFYAILKRVWKNKRAEQANDSLIDDF
jgi:membrane protein implicated in regulation of membrane protease activity